MAVQKKRRNSKGSIAIGVRDGMLRLRWTHNKKPYSFSLGLPDSPLNQKAARAKASEIERDIALGQFDTTLAKYKPSQPTEAIAPLTTLELWGRFTEHRHQSGTSSSAIAARYQPIAANLQRFTKNITRDVEAQEFVTLLRRRQSSRIANQNLSLLRGFGDWLVDNAHLDANPFSYIVPLKAAKPKPDRPFSIEEIHRLIAATDQDDTLRKYQDFILFLLQSGCRPSEVIGLRWEHVDFSRNEIHICESLSRGVRGRIRKSTKTVDGDRILSMPDNLRAMLTRRASRLARLEGLVFTSPTGKPIDDHNFSQRTWRRLCRKADVPYRRPYNARHTVASLAIEQGATLPQVAYLLGHSDTRMVSTTYGHVINRPQLPQI